MRCLRDLNLDHGPVQESGLCLECEGYASEATLLELKELKKPENFETYKWRGACERVRKEVDVKIKKNKKDGVCDAMRCKADETLVAKDDGVKLCPKHAEGYEPGEQTGTDLAPSAQASITREDAEHVEHLKSEGAEYLEAIGDFEVATQEDLDTASEVIAYAKGKHGELEAMRKRAVKPIDDARRAVQDLFKPAQHPWAEVERTLKARLAEHAEREQERNREAVESGDASGVTTTSEVEGVRTSKHWTFEITDPDAVPRELCTPDPAKIRQVISEARKAGEDPPELPGVRFYQYTRISSR